MEQYISKSALVAEIDRQKIGYNVDGKHSVEYDTTRKILNIIDTLEVKEVQEEPVSIWHDVSRETPTGFGKAIIVLCRNKNMEDGIWLADLIQDWEGEWDPRTNWETPVKWAYVKDLINLTPSEATNMGEQELVSEDLEETSKKYSSCIYLEEVLSDDDKEVLRGRLINTFKAGANWQKKQMEKEYSDLNKGLVSAKGVAVYMAYETGKKEVITKACKYLQDHREEVETEDNGIAGWISNKFIEKFSKYLEE